MNERNRYFRRGSGTYKYNICGRLSVWKHGTVALAIELQRARGRTRGAQVRYALFEAERRSVVYPEVVAALMILNAEVMRKPWDHAALTGAAEGARAALESAGAPYPRITSTEIKDV